LSKKFRVRFVSEPIVQPHPKGHKFQLQKDWFFYLNGVKITIPKGFWTDFASIPKIFRSFIPVNDTHLKAAIVHDWLYYTGTLYGKKISRRTADLWLLHACKECGTGWIKREIMFAGVRTGGWSPWNDYREKDRVRILVDAKKLIEKYSL
jgi:hypothetical protein